MAANKVLTVVGARPQFIKAAVVSHAIAREGSLEEVLVHTGQHYDANMSQTFFDELSIPEPAHNLGVSGGSHAQMTARMMVALEEVMKAEGPGCVLLYGDTNSTLAAALTAAKLHVPVAHVEAGARTHSRTNPEEINRVCTDAVSSLLLASTQTGVDNLVLEHNPGRVSFVGDPMYDAFLAYSARARKPALTDLGSGLPVDVPARFCYLTCHREENTRDPGALAGVLDAMQSLDVPVVYPVHPRNRRVALELASTGGYGNVLFVEPVGYLESVWLVNRADQVVTDSGGLQREAFFAGVKCTTVLDFECWPETMVDGRNILARPDKESVLSAMATPQRVDPAYLPFGDGHAAEGIVRELVELTQNVAKEA